MAYTKVFDNPYPDGWEDLPSEKTPLKASALQEHTDAIEHIEDYLEDYPPDNIMESLTHQKDSGYLQKNLWDEKSKSGYYNATSGTYIYSIDYFCNTNPIYVKASTRMHIVDGSGKVRALLYKADGTFLGTPYTLNVGTWTDFTTTSDCAYINIYANDSSYANNIAILYGTSGTYTPYAMPNTDLTKDVNDIDASMKMLGWTLPDSLKGMNYIDSNGIFHQKIYRVNISDLSINLSGGYYYFVANPSVINADDDVLSNVSCNKIPTIKGADFGTSTLGIAIGTSGSRIYIKDTSVTSVSAFNTKYANTYIYYELATEITKNVDGNEIAPSLKESLSQLSTPQTLNMVNLSGINSVIRKRAKQIGTLCTINALIQVKACSSDNWTQLFQLPSSARPDSNIDFGMTCGATPYSAQGLINTDGIVQIKPPSNILEGTYVTMNVAYTLI